MKEFISSDLKLGIIAGGQLGKMLSLAANNWDVKTYILDPDPNCPASTVCEKVIVGDYKNFEDVYRFTQLVDMITLEIEHVNTAALSKAKAEGKEIFPDPVVLSIIQDKGLQKQFLKTNHIPTSPFTLYNNLNEITDAVKSGKLKIPFVQKSRTFGYDGKGVVVVKKEKDLGNLPNLPSVIEEAVDIKKEISVIAARNKGGEVVCFPPVEMVFNEKANLIEELICPANISPELSEKAIYIAQKAIESFNLCGILAVEMFLAGNGELLVNEVAPRPHNSGHHTIESITTSQYEQQLRAILNYPLGSAQLKQPSIMLNLLGEPGFWGPVKYEGIPESLLIEGVKIHIYGKRETKPFRKMGHVTVIDETIEKAKIKSDKIKTTLKVKSWKNQ